MKKVKDLKGNPLLLFVNACERGHDAGEKRRPDSFRIRKELKTPFYFRKVFVIIRKRMNSGRLRDGRK